MPPNVLFVVLDTARADAFEPYGAPTGASPAFSQLARRGAFAPLAYSACNWTMPSHVAMFTGALPRSLGLGRSPNGKSSGVRPELEARAGIVLAEVLRRVGYTTSGVSCNPWISREAGFATGFDRFQDVPWSRKARIWDPSLKAKMSWMIEALLARVDDGARASEEIILGWLAEGPKQPFFWFVNIVECHSPYLPRRPYNDLGALDRLRAAREARRYLTLNGIWRACAGGFDIPDDALARMRHLYTREISIMDDWLANVLEAMDRNKVLDDTLVIVTSDHGENLGEGRLIGHAFSLDDRLIHVPLAVAGPGAPALDRVVSTSAIPRMIAEAAGIDHPWHDDSVPPGVAVAQYEATTDPSDHRLDWMRREWKLPEEGLRRFTTPMTCATDGKRKLALFGDQELLFDLEADPLELSPVTPNGHDVAPLRAALALAKSGARPPAAAAPADTSTETAELEERMRMMGYL